MKALHILILFAGVFIAFTPFEWPGTHYAVIVGVLLPVAAFAVVATLPLRNVSLAECFNAGKENGNDEDDEGAIHARVQVSAPV